MPARGPLTGLAVAALLVLTGCGSGVLVDAYPTEPGTDVDCAALVADAPRTVAGLEQRAVEGGVSAVAWGDPAVVLRCGVEMPEAFEPTSQCADIDDVDWFSETTADGYAFTTVGRRVNITVDVPAVHDPPADVLVDLASTIKRHAPVERRCV